MATPLASIHSSLKYFLKSSKMMKKSIDDLANYSNILGLKMIFLKQLLELIKKDGEIN